MLHIRLTLRPRTLLQGLAGLLLASNLLLGLGMVLGGAAGARPGAPTTLAEIRSLEAQFKALEEQVKLLRQTTTTTGAQERVTAFVRTADQRGIKLMSLTSDQRRSRFGAQELQVFASFLELQGPRDTVIALLREAPALFEGNVVMMNVEGRGTAEAWSVRLTLNQVLQG